MPSHAVPRLALQIWILGRAAKVPVHFCTGFAEELAALAQRGRRCGIARKSWIPPESPILLFLGVPVGYTLRGTEMDEPAARRAW